MCFSKVFTDLVVNYLIKRLLVTSEIQNAIKCSKDVHINCAASAIFVTFVIFIRSIDSVMLTDSTEF